MAMTTVDLYWIRMLLMDLHVLLVSPPTLWCDNLRALALLQTWFSMLEPNISRLISTSFVKKLLIKIWWFAFISTDDQVADIFTKGLSTPRFSVLWSKLLVMPCPISLQGDVKEIISIHDSANLVGKTANSFPNIRVWLTSSTFLSGISFYFNEKLPHYPLIK